jgi:purine-cytosine permease-like protein
MTLLEEFLFRRGKNGIDYNWEDYNNASRLPIGIAAFTTFLIGWAGAILCMSQVYYTGPIAVMAMGDM